MRLRKELLTGSAWRGAGGGGGGGGYLYYNILFCYLEDTSGVNLSQTIFRSTKILDRFQVNKKLQKNRFPYILDLGIMHVYISFAFLLFSVRERTLN